MRIYKFKGQRVFLYRENDMQDVKPLASDGNGIGIFKLEDADKRPSVHYGDYPTYDDYYFGKYVDGEEEPEIMVADVMDEEGNLTQNISVICSEEYAFYNKLREELTDEGTARGDTLLCRFMERLKQDYSMQRKCLWVSDWNSLIQNAITRYLAIYSRYEIAPYETRLERAAEIIYDHDGIAFDDASEPCKVCLPTLPTICGYVGINISDIEE